MPSRVLSNETKAHALEERGQRHDLFSQWIVTELLHGSVDGRCILDVGGGKGFLSEALVTVLCVKMVSQYTDCA